MLEIGTSGYSYKDWKGTFYPEDIKQNDMLSYYAEHYSFTEINSTYYNMTGLSMFKGLNDKTPDDFSFSVKAFGGFTHSRDAGDTEAQRFIESMKPIIESGKLGCILFQFPNSFAFNGENLDYLKKVREYFKNQRAAIEFRSNTWARQETMQFLKQNNAAWVCVDEPNIRGLVRPAVAVTSDIGYIRFHGRNQAKWYNHEKAYERYDYMYSKEELNEWLPRIKYINSHASKTYIAFNNHFRAQGAKNASMLKSLTN